MVRPGVGERSNNLFIVGAIGLALLAAILAFAALRAAGGSDDAVSTAGSDVVVVSERIEAGATIDADAVEIASVSESGIVEGALATLEAVVGKIARYPIEKGGQITSAMLGTETDSGGSLLGNVVAQKRRGVPVEVSEEKIFGGLLAPGDHVDVIAVFQRDVGEEEVPTARVIVQNAEVLAVAEEPLIPIARLDIDGNPIVTDQAEGVLGEQPEDLEAQPEASNVTLHVTPDEALAIALAQEEGSLWFMLRGNGDEETLPIEDQTLN
jgi:Flp pilus assembly protein CpaB